MLCTNICRRVFLPDSSAELAPTLVRCFKKFLREVKNDQECPCCGRELSSEADLAEATERVSRAKRGVAGQRYLLVSSCSWLTPPPLFFSPAASEDP